MFEKVRGDWGRVGILAAAIAALWIAGCSRVSVYTPEELPAARFATAEDEVSLVFVGDTMPWDKIEGLIERHGVDYPYRGTEPIIQQADIAVANLEGPVAVKAEMRKKQRFPYKMPPSILPGLTDAGFDLVSMANNHIWDCGEAGVRETIQNLDDAGLPFIGAGLDSREAAGPLVMETKGLRVAFLGYVSPETWIPDPEAAKEAGAFKKRQKAMARRMGAKVDRPGAMIASVLQVKLGVSRARTMADIVVVVPHWGVRYSRPVYEFQEKIAKAAIDAGADLVVGHHVHIWQPVGIYRGRPVVYGLGNYAFGSNNPRGDQGLIARAIIKDKRIQRVELIPLSTRNIDPKIDYQSKVMKGESAKTMLAELARESEPLGAVIRDDNGIGELELPEPEAIESAAIKAKGSVVPAVETGGEPDGAAAPGDNASTQNKPAEASPAAGQDAVTSE